MSSQLAWSPAVAGVRAVEGALARHLRQAPQWRVRARWRARWPADPPTEPS